MRAASMCGRSGDKANMYHSWNRTNCVYFHVMFDVDELPLRSLGSLVSSICLNLSSVPPSTGKPAPTWVGWHGTADALLTASCTWCARSSDEASCERRTRISGKSWKLSDAVPEGFWPLILTCLNRASNYRKTLTFGLVKGNLGEVKLHLPLSLPWHLPARCPA